MKFNLKKILQNSSSQLKKNVVNFPIEILICLVGGVFLAWYFSDITSHIRYVFAMAVPAVLFFNRFAKIKKNKHIYWIGSLVSIALFFFIPWETLIEASGIKSFYVIAILLMLWCCFFFLGKEENNYPFSQKIYYFFISVALSFIYTGILAGLFELIYYSCQLLFNVSDELISSEFRVYLWFFIVLPQFFLANYSNVNLRFPFLHRVIEQLFTPAVVIYTVILYLYFVKIIITTSFPEGMVSYMVLWYIGVSVFLQMNHYLTPKSNKFYNLFYEKLHYLFIFPLIMFALAVYKRIDAYGFTEDRVYLMYVGIFYLVYILLFAFPKTRKFRLLLPILILLTVIATFAPYFNVYDLSIRSQKSKVGQILSGNNMLDENGLLKPKENLEPISYSKYQTLTSALYYLQYRDIPLKNFQAFSTLKSSNNSSIEVYNLKDFIPLYYDSESQAGIASNYLSNSGVSYALTGYDTLLVVRYLPNTEHSVYAFGEKNDSLFVYWKKNDPPAVQEPPYGEIITEEAERADSLLFVLNLSDHLKEVGKNLNIDFSTNISNGQLTTAQKEVLFSVEKEPFKFILSDLSYQAYRNDSLKVTHFDVRAILMRSP